MYVNRQGQTRAYLHGVDGASIGREGVEEQHIHEAAATAATAAASTALGPEREGLGGR